MHEGRWYLRQVPRKHAADVVAALFDWHKSERASASEDLGAFLRRQGSAAIVAYLSEHPKTAELTKKTHEPPYMPTENVAAVGVA